MLSRFQLLHIFYAVNDQFYHHWLFIDYLARQWLGFRRMAIIEHFESRLCAKIVQHCVSVDNTAVMSVVDVWYSGNAVQSSSHVGESDSTSAETGRRCQRQPVWRRLQTDSVRARQAGRLFHSDCRGSRTDSYWKWGLYLRWRTVHVLRCPGTYRYLQRIVSFCCLAYFFLLMVRPGVVVLHLSHRHSGSVIHRRNEVALHWAWLVLGLVTIFGQVYCQNIVKILHP